MLSGRTVVITGASQGVGKGLALAVAAEGDRSLRLLPGKDPEQTVPLPMPMPTAKQVRIFRIEPVVISVLDYSQGFGHTDLVRC